MRANRGGVAGEHAAARLLGVMLSRQFSARVDEDSDDTIDVASHAAILMPHAGVSCSEPKFGLRLNLAPTSRTMLPDVARAPVSDDVAVEIELRAIVAFAGSGCRRRRQACARGRADR